MGFDVNFNNEPIIKQAQSAQDGGAGNLGYFQREQEEKKKKESEKSLFDGKEYKEDTFVKGNSSINDDIESESFSLSKFIAQIILEIRYHLKKFFKMD